MKRRLFQLAALGCTVLAMPAHAACSASNLYTFSYSSQSYQTLSYSGSYNYTASNSLGQTMPFTASFFANGLANRNVNGQALPAITNLITGANGARTLSLGGIFTSRTSNIESNTRVTRVTYTFAQPIRDFFIEVHDVDYTNNQFRDWMHITGSNGANTYAASMVTPHGTGNNGILPQTASGSSIRVGSPSGFPNPDQAFGTSGSDNNNVNTGTISATFAEPVTSVTLTYGNYPLFGGEYSTGQQAVGIERLSFCPMPQVSITKTSEPVSGALGAFDLPDNDVIYTITVSNTGGSPVDSNSLVLLDLLPEDIAFRNSPFDGTTSLPFKLTGSAGMSLAPSGISYSQTGNGSFGYAPAAGYDNQVDAIRLVPSGQLPANGSIAIRFRAKID
ncbi:hypothetical protein [Alteraurantiacibacter aquimixticola]|uniref:DUF11 domain-containing protein n=1 Tax=Alteraurantiacibacter aquimixticola TaxID=2489173 RepID=A0A4T3F256_9SPHN|nr:hypothetical protein [Alteraurantiacibacter aquimixticola]TIX51256.1 hypothetical protein E5222_01960 [Alteraurantiacibacter aquimixticola]